MTTTRFDDYVSHIQASREAAGQDPATGEELAASWPGFAAAAAAHAETVAAAAVLAAGNATAKVAKYRELLDGVLADEADAASALAAAEADRDGWRAEAGGEPAPEPAETTEARAGLASGEASSRKE